MPQEVIDCEVHLLHPEAIHPDFAMGTDEPVRRSVHEHEEYAVARKQMTLGALLTSMDACGISRAVIMGMYWRSPDILDANNSYIEECVRRHPERFKGLFIPDLSDPLESAARIERLDKKIFPGIKLLPAWQGIHIDDPALDPVMNVVREKGLVVMVHTDHIIQSGDGDTPFRLLNFIRRNPEIRILAPHLGGLLCLYGLLPHIKEALANVVFVTSVSATMKMVQFAAEVNSGNIMFGSDFPFNHCHDQETPLRELRSLRLPPGALPSMLGETASRIFGFDRQ